MVPEKICKAFRIKGKFISCETVKNGIINNSFKIRCDDNGVVREYLLQKINKSVFRRPDKIMKNIVGVTDHMRKRIIAEGRDPERYVLNCMKTADGKKNYFIDDDGEYWRVYDYIGHSVVYNEAHDLDIIEEIGKAFGEFQMYLSDYDASMLYVSIPDFHNTVKRFEDFERAVEVDAADRADEVKGEIEKIRSHRELACKLSLMAKNSQIPLRVTHNDTKSNNVVFDGEKREALAVIDLDTVMPGLVAYDFGDAARFLCSNAAEDETDLDKVSINVDKFRALTKGFYKAVGDSLTPLEVDTLALGLYSMTVELAVRFMTDYLDGDKYFRIYHSKHNLDRARCQLHLAGDVLTKLDLLQNVVYEFTE